MDHSSPELKELLHEARSLARQIRLSNRLQASAPTGEPTSHIHRDLALALRCADLVVAIGETTVDEAESTQPRPPVLDIGRLVAQGLLSGPPRGEFRLSDDVTLPYTRVHKDDDITLHVTVNGVDNVISIVSTRPRFGGARYWLLCPGLPGHECGKRFLHLHLPAGSDRIACRSCHRLRYEGHAPPSAAFDLNRPRRRASA